MATAPSPNDLTRQQLDELDALLQRMLSLPLTPPEAPPSPGSTGVPFAPSAVLPTPPLPEIPTPPPVKNWRVDPPAANPGVHATVAPAQPPLAFNPMPAHETPVAAPAFPAPAAAPLRAPVALLPDPEPEPEAVVVPQPAAIPVPRPVAAPRATPKSAPPPTPTARPLPVIQPKAVAPRSPRPHVATSFTDDVPLPLWPVAALNAAIEALLGLLGPVGWLLRTRFVKNLFGLAGIALLIYTAAHVAQSGGWITLPIELPWPR